MSAITEQKCPHCGGAVEFNVGAQKLKCPYCDAEFDIAAMQQAEDFAANTVEQINWNSQGSQWGAGETDGMSVYACKSCGGEIVADATTGATTCPYCDNPVVMTGQFAGALKPDLVIPFKLDKKAAKVIEGESLDLLIGSIPMTEEEDAEEKVKEKFDASDVEILENIKSFTRQNWEIGNPEIDNPEIDNPKFKNVGTYYLYMEVKDNNGTKSEIYKKTIVVSSTEKPYIKSIHRKTRISTPGTSKQCFQTGRKARHRMFSVTGFLCSFGFYLAYSTTLVSRSTWTLIWPGYSSSFSMRFASSRARMTI